MPEEIELILIRHGKTRGNTEKRYIGCTDEPLSAKGRAELETRKKRGIYPAAGSLYLSPMQRCKQTADILYPGRIYTLIDEFREMDFGRFEGKNYAELSGDPDYQAWIDSGGLIAFPGGESRAEFIRRSLQGFQQMMRLETCSSINAGFCKSKNETNEDWNGEDRNIEAISEMPVRSENRGNDESNGTGEMLELSGHIENVGKMPVRRITLIAHGGTIMALLSALCGGDYWDYQVPNGDGFRVQLRPAAEGGPGDGIFCWKGAYAERLFALSYDRVCGGICAGSDSGRSAPDAASGTSDRTSDQRL